MNSIHTLSRPMPRHTGAKSILTVDRLKIVEKFKSKGQKLTRNNFLLIQ